jgi:predicted aspartyl protease
MSVIYVNLKVAGPNGKSRACRLLVDSGAVYSQLPEEIWKPLKLRPQSAMDFTLADGTTIRRRVSECIFEFRDVRRHSPVILGDKGDPALLGAVTLETMGLVLNPFKRTLQPMQLVLASSFFFHLT